MTEANVYCQDLRGPFSVELSRAALVAMILGVCFHLAIRDVEVDYRLWRMTAIWTTLATMFVFTLIRLCDFTILQALGRLFVVSWSFNIGLALSMGIYRVFLHRLRNFPGPFGAKLSRLYAVKASSNLQYNRELENMHEKYGDVVRTGPRELMIIRASAVNAVNGPQTECRKSTWYSQVSDDPTMISLNSCRDWDDHKRRKRAWDRAFSVKSLGGYEPSVRSKIATLVSQFKARSGQPVDATAWTMYLTFDVMGKVGFGKDYNQLETGQQLPAIQGLHDQMGVLGLLSPLPWLLSFLSAIPGLSGSYGLFMNYCAEQVAEKKKRWEAADKGTIPTDTFSWLLKAKDENDQSAPPGEGALNEDSRLIIIAGSDTTATAMASALFYLTKHQTIYKKLQSIGDALPKKDYDSIKNIPLLDGIINETLRLRPVIPSGQPRVTPANGMQIDEYHIPGDVNVILPQWVIQQDERYFEDAKSFIPERWTPEKSHMVKDRNAFFPFQLGAYACVGKQLALMQLRHTIFSIASNFDIALAPDETGEKFEHGAKDTFVFTLEPLWLVFRERK